MMLQSRFSPEFVIDLLPTAACFIDFDRRSHNPNLREARLDEDVVKIPWLANHLLGLVYA